MAKQGCSAAQAISVALAFCGSDDPATQLSLVRSLSEQIEQFGHRRVQLFVVVPWNADQARQAADQEGLLVPMLADPEGHLRRRFENGDAAATTTFLIDPQGAIADVVRHGPGASLAPAVLERIDTLAAR